MDFGFDASRTLLWIVLLPLAGAILNGLFGRFADKRLVSTVAVGSVAGSFGLAVIAFASMAMRRYGEVPDESARLVYDFYEWFQVSVPSLDGGASDVPVVVRFVMDPLGGVMTLVVTGIGLLIHVYSLGYMEDEPSYARFFAYLNLFMASMLVLVLASSLPVMFVGWEGVGLCSYLLIGFWWDNPTYAAAGRKAFVVNRIGDFGVLIGMFFLVSAVHSFEFDAINAAAPELTNPASFGLGEAGSIATVASLFLFLGCAGKSAQIPLYVWLPDAMAGPTPVSALIHAATMVTAGVYLCCRVSPVIFESPTAMAVIALVGASTALLAASIGCVQHDIKKILAYSTVSQLGFMFAAVGVGAYAAAIFHVFTHAFFKACLFLGAGAVMHAVHAHGDADIRKLGGLRHHLPTVRWTFLASCLAIAGVPLFSGFFSKDEILLGSLMTATSEGADSFHSTSAWIVFVVLVLAATMTAFYMFRLYFLTFEGEYRSAKDHHGEDEAHEAHGHDDHGYAAHPHRPPLTMRVPLIVLGAGAVVVGYLNLDPILHFFHAHFDPWVQWLAPSLAGYQVEAETMRYAVADHGPAWIGYAALGAGTVAMLVGAITAYNFYMQRGGAPAAEIAQRVPRLHELVFDKWRVDEAYGVFPVGFVQGMARVAGFLDTIFVDGLLTKVTSRLVEAGGWVFTRLQNGVVYSYAAAMVVGFAVLTWWFIYPHPQIEAEAVEAQVTFSAGRGLGYEYRWDGDSDGEFETEWAATGHRFQHRYDSEDFVGYTIVMQTGPRAAEETLVVEDELIFEEGMMGRRWARTEDGDVMPAVRLDEDGRLFLLPNDAFVRVDGEEITRERMLLPGAEAVVGGARIRVGAIVRATLQVRNAFGNVQTDTIDVQLVPGPPQQAALELGGSR